MSGEDSEPRDDSGGAPVDFDRLDSISTRLATDDRFTRIEEHPEFAPDRLVCIYDDRFYPASVGTATLEIVFFEYGDFSIHYHEAHEDESFDHRWDRHPSEHNTRDHIHPGPDAPTPGEDESYPQDWRDVLTEVLVEIEERQREFWKR